MRRGIARLGEELAGVVNQRFVGRDQHAAAGGGDGLGAVQENAPITLNRSVSRRAQRPEPGLKSFRKRAEDYLDCRDACGVGNWQAGCGEGRYPNLFVTRSLE